MTFASKVLLFSILVMFCFELKFNIIYLNILKARKAVNEDDFLERKASSAILKITIIQSNIFILSL